MNRPTKVPIYIQYVIKDRTTRLVCKQKTRKASSFLSAYVRNTACPDSIRHHAVNWISQNISKTHS